MQSMKMEYCDSDSEDVQFQQMQGQSDGSMNKVPESFVAGLGQVLITSNFSGMWRNSLFTHHVTNI